MGKRRLSLFCFRYSFRQRSRLGKNRRKSFVPVFFAVLIAGIVSAGEITPEQAQTAAKNWAGSPLRAYAARSARRQNRVVSFKGTDDTPLFHVVELDGGGFIVTSADDGVEPVIAFSDAESSTQTRKIPSGPC